jgi:2,4-dienoyl-CoA reductase-like NADH-dependent reductase (Old Yellow Enzyme family)
MMSILVTLLRKIVSAEGSRGSRQADHRTKFDDAKMSSLFQEFRLTDVVLRNRIAVSPMCQYSSDNGFPTLNDSVELVRRLKSAGLDLLDVSHGSITPDISKVPWGPGFMVPAASRIRRESAIPTAVGWQITEPQQAEDAIRDQHTDLVMLAREMLRDPYWPYHAALELGDEKAQDILPIQYRSCDQEEVGFTRKVSCRFHLLSFIFNELILNSI